MRRAASLFLCAWLVTLGCSSRSPERSPQKLVILGFDGMDPTLVRRWIAAGFLPTLAQIAKSGGLYPLETTLSPESPTAWASFATGVNAGQHNIFDFLVRDTRTYLPDLSMVRREPARFLFNYIPISRPKIRSIRGGTSFWVTAGRAGVRTSVLTVPVTFPPEEVPHGELLSGLPLPDIRGTMGTFYYFATDLTRYEEGDTEFGGILKRLVFDGQVAKTELIGPPNPIVKQQIEAIRTRRTVLDEEDRARLRELEARQDVRIPFTIRWNREGGRTGSVRTEAVPEAGTATIEMQGQAIHLREGQWSRWIKLDFQVNLFIRLRGMAQMFLISAGDDLRLYVSPVNWQPDAPPLPMSSPSSFAGALFERLGPYRTLGWAEATWPLEEGRIDEKTFLDDLYRAFDDRAQVILNRVDARNWDLLVGVIESTDRVQHMMWRLIDPEHPMFDAALAGRFGDAIARVYRRADALVAQVLERLDRNTVLLIVSDHGFHSWRRAVNLNTWLVQQGYMALQGQRPGEKKLDDLFGGGQFWEDVDWSRTRAYAMGLGQIYFNLRGREAQGIVGPEHAKTLAVELRAKLLGMRDPETTARMVRNVYTRDEAYSGPFLHNAADLQVGFEDGYRVSWQTALGGSPPGIVYANKRKWSADHASFDYQTTAGVLISSRKLIVEPARIIDIAPTALKHFGIPIATNLDGKPLF